MSEKVLLKKKEAEAIELYKDDFPKISKEKFLELHAEVVGSSHSEDFTRWESKYDALNDMSMSKLAKAIILGYEIEEPTPQFEPGDLIINERTGVLVELNKQTAELTNTDYWDKENVRHATPDEIYWLHDLKRDCVNDFKAGDVVLDTNGYLYRIIEDSEDIDGEEDWCTVNDAIEWFNKNKVEVVYPVESRKPYRKEES